MKSPLEDVQIRRMALADLTRVMAIAASLPNAPHWPESAYLDAVIPESTPPRIALVVTDPQPEDVRGFAVAKLLPPQAELETIAVAVERQRQGLGRRLFDALAEELRQAGVHEVLLEVRASNRAALAFHRSVGFGKKGLRPRYYEDPIEDAVLMGLKLG